MQKQNLSKLILYGATIANLGLLSYTMKKPHKKDWIFAYLFNLTTNALIDTILVRTGVLDYPVRLFPRIFKINSLFDFLVYPTITVVYNQWTYKTRSKFAFIAKVLFFAVPFTIIESWFHFRTQLVKWKRGYTWYHTLLGVTSKSLITRYAVSLFRRFTKDVSQLRVGGFGNMD